MHRLPFQENQHAYISALLAQLTLYLACSWSIVVCPAEDYTWQDLDSRIAGKFGGH